MNDSRRRQGPITWTRPPGAEDATHLAVTVYDVDGGAQIVVDVDGRHLEATLAGDAEMRPVVLELDEEVTIGGDTVAAIRLPEGTDIAIADAVRAFQPP